ncbi:Hypothetical predicted protein [Olea europaea subsp. europaea]|uniref:Uncharacterized protein n=1 Tax=Olea europaea subsp. europaea TaxID=158383 RepID=A0A8S0UCZ6_OLEEU|nr:Hypothetical predicted protein [Olea europaea subsp. europaea]
MHVELIAPRDTASSTGATTSVGFTTIVDVVAAAKPSNVDLSAAVSIEDGRLDFNLKKLKKRSNEFESELGEFEQV